MAYECPFCGREITKGEILFVHESDSTYFKDEVRYNFLFECSSSYPFEAENTFKGKYYRPTESNITRQDSQGFPTVIRVRPSEGLTPEQLLNSQSAAGEVAADADDFLAMIQETPKAPQEKEIDLAIQACPHCHCRLPQGFGSLPIFNIALVGGRASGKTAYLISLLQQLDRQLSANQLGTISLLKESGTYIEGQVKYYVDNHGVALPTEKNDKLFPLVFHFSRGIFANQKEEGPQECLIAIHDMAGEGLEDPTYLINRQGLKRAQIVMLMLDPNMINDGGFWNALNAMENAQGGYQEPVSTATGTEQEQHDYFAEPIAAFLANTLNILKIHDFKIGNVIAVVTKIDLPLRVDQELFGGSNVLIKSNTNNAHIGKINMQVLAQIENELLHYFNYKLGGTANHRISLKSMIQNAFGGNVEANLFAVSTYTRMSDEGKNIVFKNLYQETAAKHRIIEPFLKLLVLTNMLPTHAGPQGNPKRKDKKGLFHR